MCEPARHDHGVDAPEGGIAVPQDVGVAAQEPDRLEGVELAVGTGELDDADARRHQADAPAVSVMVASSITGLVRKRRHRSSTSVRAVASSAASRSKRIALP